MKKIFKIVSLVMIMACLAGCGKEAITGDGTTNTITEESTTMKESTTAKENTTEEESTTAKEEISSAGNGVRYAEKYQMVSLSEAGIIYDGRDMMIHLVNVDEGKDMLLCYDPNCKHPTARETDGDPKCRAALYDSLLCKTAYYEGAVYFFTSTGISEHRIYKMNTNGAGRKLIAELPFAFDIGYACIFLDDKLYYTAQISHKDEITNRINYTYRFVEVNLLDGSYRFITEDTNDLMDVVNIAGNTIYMRMADVDDDGRLYMVTIDRNTLEKKVIISADEWATGNRYIDAYDEDSFFYWGKNTYEIGIMNVDGTIEKVLLKGAEGESFGGADPSCDGLFYQRLYDYGDEPVGAYFMDLTTGEVVNITEETEKYGIVGYDGYYDAFVARVYVESEWNFHWSMWSKEKILSEAEAGS